MKRALANYNGLIKYFGHEDGKQYVGHVQSADDLLKHVKYLNDKVNGAPARTNINKWRYAGSIPTQLIVSWCSSNGYTFNDFACNTDNAKKKFMAWFTTEYPKLTAKPGASAMPKIVVPLSYKPRKNAAVEGAHVDS